MNQAIQARGPRLLPQRALRETCVTGPPSSSPLQGASIVVTGAGGDIGRAIARTLAGLGGRLCLVGRGTDRLDETAEGLVGPVESCPADLTCEQDVDALERAIRCSFGEHLDVLVHCAGVYNRAAMEQANIEDLDRQFEANVSAPYRLTKRLLPMLKAAKGQIVFLNSTQGLRATATVGQYAATQHALTAIADSLRDEVNEHGIRVLTIYSGRTATKRQEAIFRAEGRPYRPELLLQPQDLADMIASCLTLPRTAEVTNLTMRPMIKSY